MFFFVLIFILYIRFSLLIRFEFEIGLMDFSTIVLTDQYFLVFIYTLFYFSFLMKMNRLINPFILLRNKKKITFWNWQLIKIVILSFTLSGIMFLLSLFVGVFYFKYSSTITKSLTDHPIAIYGMLFNSPITAIFAILGFTSIGSIFLGALFSYINFRHSKKMMILVFILAYFGGVIGLHRGWDSIFPYIFINNYLVLHHALLKGIHFQIILFGVTLLCFFRVMIERKKGCIQYE